MSIERSMLRPNNSLMKGNFSSVPGPFEDHKPAGPMVIFNVSFESFTHKISVLYFTKQKR